MLLSIGDPWTTGKKPQTKRIHDAPKELDTPGEIRVPIGKRQYVYITPVQDIWCQHTFVLNIFLEIYVSILIHLILRTILPHINKIKYVPALSSDMD